MQRRQTGLTLIEILVSLAIIGILSAVALPSYRDYVTRGRLGEAFSALGAVQANAEQFWSNTRSFQNFDGASNGFPATSPNFTYTLSNATVSTYTVKATGKAAAEGFEFTVDQQGNRVTTAVPAGWNGTGNTCWVDRRSGACTQ
jgi:type IV pilus assembly protein PilE